MTTAEFQKKVNFNAMPVQQKRSPHDILDELEVAVTRIRVEAVSLGMRADELDGVIDRLIVEAEKNWMQTQYAVLDLSFTESTRKVLIGPNENSKLIAKAWDTYDGDTPKGHAWFNLPNYVIHWDEFSDIIKTYHVGLREDSTYYRSGSPFLRVDLGIIERWREGNIHHSRVNVQARLEIPSGMTQICLATVRQAIAFRDLFDIALFLRGLANTRRSRGHHDSDVGVLWGPIEEAWSFESQTIHPKGDPAILLKGRDEATVYLLGFFDTPNERPIENIIREFSEGKVPKKMKSKKK